MAATETIIGKEIRYGHVDGLGKGREYPVKGNQFFHRRGGHFVYLSALGSVQICSTSLPLVFGWADTPKDTSGHNSWKSAASGDTGFPSKVFVIRGIENRFIIPFNINSIAMSASLIGEGAYVATANEAASMYSSVQKAYWCTNATSANLTIEDIDLNNSTVTVSMRPQAFQSMEHTT